MAAARSVGGGIGKQRGHMEIGRGHLVPTADDGERIGELLLDDMLAERAQLQAGAARVDEPRRADRDEPHHVPMT